MGSNNPFIGINFALFIIFAILMGIDKLINLFTIVKLYQKEDKLSSANDVSIKKFYKALICCVFMFDHILIG